MTSVNEAGPAGRGAWVRAVGLAALVSVPYLQTLEFGYTLDDVHVVQNNPVVRELRWREAVTGPYWPEERGLGASNWRPLATLSWCVDRWLAGGVEERALRLHHGGNVLLHALVVLAAYAVARRLSGSEPAALISAAVFAVHPSHAEVVAPVVGRTDLLASLGALTMCAGFWRFRDTARPLWLALATLAYAVGLGGKESAALVGLLLPVSDVLLRRPSLRGRLVRASLPYLPLILVAGVYLGLRTEALGAQSVVSAQAASLDLGERLVFSGRNTILSTALLVLPVRFHHALTTLPAEAFLTYPLPTGPLRSLWWLAALPLWLGFVPLVRRAPAIAIAWLGAILAWLPVSGLVPVAAGVSLRYLFLPSSFVAAGAAAAARTILAARPRWRAPLLVGAAAAGLVLLTITWVRLPAWASNRSFFTSVVREEPRSIVGNMGLGTTYATASDYDEARKWYERAVGYAGGRPESFQARENLAMTYEYDDEGRRFGPRAPLEVALEIYREALAVKPDALVAGLGASTAALALAERLAEDDPRGAELRRGALADLVKALESHPTTRGRTALRRRAAELAVELGDAAEARRQLLTAAQERLAERDRQLAREGRLAWSRSRQRALRDLEEALSLDPPPGEEELLRERLRELRAAR